jgi:hypothetical protein
MTRVKGKVQVATYISVSLRERIDRKLASMTYPPTFARLAERGIELALAELEAQSPALTKPGEIN